MNGPHSTPNAHGFRLDAMDEITYACSPEIEAMYKLSPFVWRNGAGYAILLRVVNRHQDASQKVARIHYGTSSDGVRFVLEPQPVLRPGDDPTAYDNGG